MKFIHLEFDGSIATVTLDHSVGNRINFQMRKEILAALERVVVSQARVLLIKGKGSDFCLGGDIRDWPGIPSSELRPKVEIFGKAIDLLESLSIPTIAVVHGNCVGGGFELALGCDLIIASASANFGFPEAMLGIMTLQGGIYQLAERIGRSKAIELVLLSELVDANRMAEWNVVNRVVDDALLNEEARRLAARLAAGSPQVHAGTKALLRTWRLQGCASAREALYEASMPLFDTLDVQTTLRRAVDALNAGHPIPIATFLNE
ncbi:enoyl-CoA hydratase/isomerase family protein [Pseudomonas tolaasii]|uniref:enoyl-CoA hydratase/isomerase family protein n=1 Tax=Pseudomonas tolaasii TaxID=29442 RepID=UPI001C5767CB|nr:enoyl-CoA hydratase/isomerase family protein [Pseudomonas tolaasii]MBW1248770.1 enoyl-CoA hydratase/isomerase family protein [Pseudomonas tolaasii]